MFYDIVSLAHNVSFWAQKLNHYVSIHNLEHVQIVFASAIPIVND